MIVMMVVSGQVSVCGLSNCDQIIINASHHMIIKTITGTGTRLALSVMALPVSLRNSITPPELELIASEELVEIIPLISMERTAFISV